MQARLSIMRAARQLGEEAGIHLHIRHFDIINEVTTFIALEHARDTLTSTESYLHCHRQVGAVSIDAALNCEAFASAHSSTSHYDRDSFVRRRRIRARRARALSLRLRRRRSASPGARTRSASAAVRFKPPQ